MKNVANLHHSLVILLLALLFGTATAMADTVKGTVVDDTGEPLIGATVQLKGAPGVATATDIDGNYTIKLPDAKKNVLVFSYIGMDPKEVQVNGQTTINVTLTTNTTQLDEVVDAAITSSEGEKAIHGSSLICSLSKFHFFLM